MVLGKSYNAFNGSTNVSREYLEKLKVFKRFLREIVHTKLKVFFDVLRPTTRLQKV